MQDLTRLPVLLLALWEQRREQSPLMDRAPVQTTNPPLLCRVYICTEITAVLPNAITKLHLLLQQVVSGPGLLDSAYQIRHE